MSNISYYTNEGLQKLKDDLIQMESIERPSISQQIAEARDKGDLSENAEYHAAKEALALLEGRIARLQDVVANGRTVDGSLIDSSRALILSTVKIKNLKNKAILEYTLVAENEADLKSKKISVTSPIGKGLLGKSIGEVAKVTTPTGDMRFEVLEISR